MKRFDDWTVRLDAYLRWMAEQAFSWGTNDCALFVCNCVREMTGKDPAAGYRNRYRNRKDALEILKESSLETIADRIATVLGAHEIRPPFAQRGDVVLVETDQGAALAIVDLTGERLVGAGPAGMVCWKLSAARRAWRI